MRPKVTRFFGLLTSTTEFREEDMLGVDSGAVIRRRCVTRKCVLPNIQLTSTQADA